MFKTPPKEAVASVLKGTPLKTPETADKPLSVTDSARRTSQVFFVDVGTEDRPSVGRVKRTESKVITERAPANTRGTRQRSVKRALLIQKSETTTESSVQLRPAVIGKENAAVLADQEITQEGVLEKTYMITSPTATPCDQTTDDSMDLLKDIPKMIKHGKDMIRESQALMNKSGNLKKDIKDSVTDTLTKLDVMLGNFALISTCLVQFGPRKLMEKEEGNIAERGELSAQIAELMETMRVCNKNTAECTHSTRALTQEIQTSHSTQNSHLTEGVTYAGAAAKKMAAVPPPMHSIIVSSENKEDTSGTVTDKVRAAVNAIDTGLRVDRMRKVKNQKIVLGCHSKMELDHITKRLKESDESLRIEEAVNKLPLVVLKDVLSYNTDEDITRAILNQNSHLLEGLDKENTKMVVRYRKRARNPHENHVVMQVSPQIWQRLTEAGRVHIDMQRVKVFDQTPLMQCTRCLRFGHGKKQCTEEKDACSHCGGHHLRAECPSWRAGDPPSCRNCHQAKLDDIQHNAFSTDCITRRKWDKIARSSVSYC